MSMVMVHVDPSSFSSRRILLFFPGWELLRVIVFPPWDGVIVTPSDTEITIVSSEVVMPVYCT